MSADDPKCGTFDRAPHDPDDPTARLSPEFEQAVRSSISKGRAAPSLRVLYGEVVALRAQLAAVESYRLGMEQVKLLEALPLPRSITTQLAAKDEALRAAVEHFEHHSFEHADDCLAVCNPRSACECGADNSNQAVEKILATIRRALEK